MPACDSLPFVLKECLSGLDAACFVDLASKEPASLWDIDLILDGTFVSYRYPGFPVHTDRQVAWGDHKANAADSVAGVAENEGIVR
jgi:hypothetical protein